MIGIFLLFLGAQQAHNIPPHQGKADQRQTPGEENGITVIAPAPVFGGELDVDGNDGNRVTEKNTQTKPERDEQHNSLGAPLKAILTALSEDKAGWGQVFIGVLGLVGLGFTVFYARRAWQTSDDAARTARDIGQKQVRGYLAIERAKFGHIAGFITVNVGIKNAGQSPILQTRIEVAVEAPQKAGSIEEAFADPVYRTRMVRSFDLGCCEAGITTDRNMNFIGKNEEEAPADTGFRLRLKIFETDIFNQAQTIDCLLIPDHTTFETNGVGTERHTVGQMLVREVRRNTQPERSQKS